ncbi:MAG: hypothetical protein ABI380_14560 [Edaphobacter sp.]
MKRMLRFAVVIMAVCLPGYGQQTTAAESKPANSAVQELGKDQRFRLTFVLRETDENGKVLNSREYEAMIGAIPRQGNPNVSIRNGIRMPVPTSPTNSSYTYQDVGANFDINSFTVVSSNRVALNVSAEVSNIDSAAKNPVNPPLIRQNKWTGNEQIVLGERKVIFSSDDLTSRNKMQVELTVTRVD